MLIKNLCSLIIPPIVLFLLTKRPTVSVLFLALLFTVYSPDKSKQIYNPNIVYCPSSGKIMNISIDSNNNIARIAIFLNIYNNHTQYMPIDSTAVEINRIHGPNFPAYTLKSSHNEQLVTLLYNQNKDMYYKIYQMTGIIARRLKTMLKINHSYTSGDRLGFIFLGSRVDIEVPLNKIKKILIRNKQIMSSMEPIILLN